MVGSGGSSDSEEPSVSAASEPSDFDDRSDPEEKGGSGNPAVDRSDAEALIGQERDRLEVRMAQLNRQLEDALTARDSSSSNDAKRWNKRIQQLQAQIEKEKKRSETRIEEIRSQSGL